MSQVHVIGAGLAGLSAALSLTAAGRSVVIHEAGPAAGGRCRSYFDKELGIRIDNGNHLLLSGNKAAAAYINEIGAHNEFQVLNEPVFPFMDLRTGERWSLRPNLGRIPWWIFRADRRVPATRFSDYLGMARIIRIRDETPVADSMHRGRLYWRMLEPLAVAALNTQPQEGLGRLLGAVMRETLMRGGRACIPMLPKQGLSEALIDPAVKTLRARGADVRLNDRVSELVVESGRVTALRGPEGAIPVARDDALVLAVPPWVAGSLLPGLAAPEAFEAILNIHFLYDAKDNAPLGEAGFIGLTSGTAEWVFMKPRHVSVTISAAKEWWTNRPDDRRARVAERGGCSGAGGGLQGERLGEINVPPYRVVKEKRATFAATARQEARRPVARTDLAANLVIAGDWTDTGLPATIEGAIRSGRSAASALLTP